MRAVVVVVLDPPRRPTAGVAARRKGHRAGAAPVERDHVEPRRGGLQRAGRVQRHLAHRQCRPGGERRSGCGERRDRGEEKLHRQAQGARLPSAPGSERPCPATIFTDCACVSRRARLDSGARRRRQRVHEREARSGDPVRARPRGQPGHAGLPDEPALEGRERSLRRGRDPARHAGRPLDVDEDDLHGGAQREAAGDRLRLA